jgi:N-acetyl-gamma-glutamyl-phosphate reductase
MRAGLAGTPVVVNALSGVSGAGKKAKEHLLYTSRTENAAAYAPGRSHRHWQEIISQAQDAGFSDGELYFTPHLIPVHHGMEVTSSFPLSRSASDGEIGDLFADAYGKSAFVRLRGDIPETAQVRGTNRCDFTWHREGDQLFLISVIDNLYKGAGGQAVQNMNIRFGLPETAGLELHGEI